MRAVRVSLQVLLFLLPWPVRRRVLAFVFKFTIDPRAHIGLSLVDVRRLEMGPESRIGSFNVIHGLELLRIGENSLIGRFNWIAGAFADSPIYRHSPTRRSELIIGRHAAITAWHWIDCADRIEFGAFSTMAGTGSQVFTHGIDIETNRQICSPVTIGAYSLINTRTLIVRGTSIADCCIVAAGSVCLFSTSEAYGLYAGIPAKRIGELHPNAGYFHRSVGPVD